MTQVIMVLSIVTLDIVTFSMMTLIIVTFNIMKLSTTAQHNIMLTVVIFSFTVSNAVAPSTRVKLLFAW